MPSTGNKVIIACAGSGKTTRLVDEALNDRDRRIAIITYTNNNVREIIQKFGYRNSGIPKHVDVMTWYGFLLRECARPYQQAMYTRNRIESLLFVNRRSTRYVSEKKIKKYYFANDELIYSDKIAQFVVKCETHSSNAVTARLGQIYTDIFIDEFQDLAGWDLDVIWMLLRSGVRVTLVGDPRQHTYTTNPSGKNQKYLGLNIVNLVERWAKKGLCSIEYMNASHRCSDPICEFSNRLWPGMEAMTSLRNDTTDHEGVFLVAESSVGQYIQHFSPQILRYSKSTKKIYGHGALNFGAAKGLQFERVLIIPTGGIKKYLQTGELSHVEKSMEELHVAVTRAKHSIAFVYDGRSPIVSNRWFDTVENPQMAFTFG